MKAKLKNPQNYDVIEVEWLDSTTPGDSGWFDLDIDDDEFMLSCYTAGYLVRETDIDIWVVNSYHVCDADVRSLGLIAIPKVAITKRELLKKGAKDGVLQVDDIKR